MPSDPQDNPQQEDNTLDSMLEQAPTADNADEEKKEDVAAVVDNYPPHKFTMKYAFHVEDAARDNERVFHFPSTTTTRTVGKINSSINLELDVKDEATTNWANALSNGYKLNTTNNRFSKSLEDGDYRQYVESPDVGEITAGSPPVNQANKTFVSGREALLRVMSHVGSGNIFHVPMWHSGFWVTLKPPTETELLELYRVINNDKIKFGRYSYGAVYSNTSAYTIKRLTDFALEHVMESTLKVDDDVTIRDALTVQDIPILLWGLACTIYPSGFNYDRACVTDPKKCNHVTSGVLDLSKLLWVDNSVLNKAQVTMMTKKREATYPIANINSYKEAMDIAHSQVSAIKMPNGNDITFTFKTPSLVEYITSGYDWIEGINNTIEESLSIDTDDDQRNTYIRENSLATFLRQYGHWVDQIDMGPNGIINKTNDVEQALESLSTIDIVRKAFVKEVTKYIDRVTMAVIAIPEYDCPACGSPQEGDGDGTTLSKHLLPLDVSQVFFTILGERISRVLGR